MFYIILQALFFNDMSEFQYNLFLSMNGFSQYFEALFGIFAYKFKIDILIMEIVNIDRIILGEIVFYFIKNIENGLLIVCSSHQ